MFTNAVQLIYVCAPFITLSTSYLHTMHGWGGRSARQSCTSLITSESKSPVLYLTHPVHTHPLHTAAPKCTNASCVPASVHHPDKAHAPDPHPTSIPLPPLPHAVPKPHPDPIPPLPQTPIPPAPPPSSPRTNPPPYPIACPSSPSGHSPLPKRASRAPTHFPASHPPGAS